MNKTTKYAGTQTEKNLMAAFAGESEARNKYTYFASKAKKDGFEQIAALFLKTAENEKEHAKLWFKELEGIGSTAENLLSAAVQGGENVLVNIRVVDGVRKVGSRDVTEATAALVEELGRLSVTACVDYDPAEGAAAICGLDAPDAQALVTYTNELGTESTLTLTVGLPDGSGGRYVTVNDDPTIYRMEETSLVQLLTLAETGLK